MSVKVNVSGKPTSALKTDSGFRGFLRKLSLSKKESTYRHEEVLVPPPPPYKVTPPPTRPVHVVERGIHSKDRHTPSTPASITPNSTPSMPIRRPPQSDLTPEEKERRRARRLSKLPPPPPSSNSNATTTVYSSNSKALGSSRTSISSFFHYNSTTRTGTTKTNVDSSGRTRPPVSGTPSRHGLGGYRSSNNNNIHNASSHPYHYQRARSNSSTDLSRLHEAISCLEAVLDAYDANLVTDVRHVVEQVALARDILAGEDCAGTGSASTAFLMKSAKASQLTVDSVDLPPPPSRMRPREERTASPNGSGNGSSSSGSSMERRSGDSLSGRGRRGEGSSEASSVTSIDSRMGETKDNKTMLIATIPSFPLAAGVPIPPTKSIPLQV